MAKHPALPCPALPCLLILPEYGVIHRVLQCLCRSWHIGLVNVPPGATSSCRLALQTGRGRAAKAALSVTEFIKGPFARALFYGRVFAKSACKANLESNHEEISFASYPQRPHQNFSGFREVLHGVVMHNLRVAHVPGVSGR